MKITNKKLYTFIWKIYRILLFPLQLCFPTHVRFKNYTIYRIRNDRYTLIIANCKKGSLTIPEEFKDIECLIAPYNHNLTTIDLSNFKICEPNLIIKNKK
jgi:hypothetical protein